MLMGGSWNVWRVLILKDRLVGLLLMLLGGLLLGEDLLLMNGLWVVWLMLVVEDGMLMVSLWKIWLILMLMLMLKGGLVGLLLMLIGGLLVNAHLLMVLMDGLLEWLVRRWW